MGTEERDVVMSETETETAADVWAAEEEEMSENMPTDADSRETEGIEEEMSETDETETETETEKKSRPYFAIYYDDALLKEVDAARGTQSANSFLGTLLYNHFKVEMPVRKTRSKYATKEEAKAAAKKSRDIKNAAMKMLAEKYATEMAAALAALKGE